MRWLLLLFAAWSSWQPAVGYKVLCVFPIPSRSHNNLAKGIVDSLLEAGHQVTWVSPYPDSKPTKNLEYIDVSGAQAIASAIDMTNPQNANNDIEVVIEFAKNVSILVLKNPVLRQKIVNEQYDAVVTEWFFSQSDAGFAAVQQVPWIVLSSTSILPELEGLMDEVRSVSTHPLLFNPSAVPMSFWQRLVNVGIYVAMYAFSWSRYGAVSTYYETQFSPLAASCGVTLPPLGEALHNISILLVNSHPSISPAMTLGPNVIDVAGYHIDEEVKPLPEDLQQLLDSATQGAVYFSLGSVVRSASLPAATRRALLRALGALGRPVLWKFEAELEDAPPNVYARTWFPQASVLAHKNVRVFITHGGLLSTLEAVSRAVPLLAVPVFGDQPANARRSELAGFARVVPLAAPDLPARLEQELKEMLTNDSYYERVQYVSKLFRSRPVPPKKLISHYIELAIETKGAHHLRPLSRQYWWYERWMLDVAAALLAALLTSLYALKLALRRMFASKAKGTKPRGDKVKTR